MMTVSSPSAVAKGDINIPQVSSGDKSGKLLLKKGEREREREILVLLVCKVGGLNASLMSHNKISAHLLTVCVRYERPPTLSYISLPPPL